MLRLLLISVLLAGCTSAPPPPPGSMWGDVLIIAQAEQGAAPALWDDGQQLTAAWVGADDAGIHHDARQISADGALVPSLILPLPPTRPHQQTLLPASDGQLHLTWIDANAAGENRLYSALLNRDLSIERGPVEVSSAPTYAHAVLPAAGGGLWAAWSGGLLAEPILYLQAIDPAGRPLPPIELAADAHFPALTAVSGAQLLFWISGDGQVMRARLADGVLLESAVITSAPYLDPSDRLDGMVAGADTSHAYLFWNITRAGSTHETWFSAAAHADRGWSPPRPLTLVVNPDVVYQTGFDAPTAHSARLADTGGLSARWATPAMISSSALPVGLETDEGLAVVWFEAGEAAGYQRVIADVRLIGPPALLADARDALTLAWSQPHTDRPADLSLTSTR